MDCRSSPELSRGEHEAERRPTFEETYPRHEFAELVRLGLALAQRLVQAHRRIELRRRPDLSPPPLPGGTSPAE